nr:heat shock transcription factor 1 [Chilo suppressalis]
MRSVVEIGASVPAFLGKLWKLVNDTETNHLISWSPGGKTFVIKNQAEFARELLPLYYKHNNMASFIRQLNMYGFHKITSVETGGLRYEKDEIEFSHPCFMKGHAYLLEHIKRKIANPKTLVTSNESGEKILIKPELMNKVLADVKQMKGKQESLDAKFSAMKQENEALWREVAILRQKHIKQQQIVNNLIQFLMSLVQPTRPPNCGGNNVGVKRPYQLMINNAAHNSSTDTSHPSKSKNFKFDKETIPDDLNEDNLEDGPTIHELAYDDILHNETSQDTLEPSNFVTVELPPGGSEFFRVQVPTSASSVSPDPTASSEYQVTMEDGEETSADGPRSMRFYPICRTNGTLPTPETPAAVSPTVPITTEQIVSNLMASPGTSKTKSRTSGNKSSILNNKSTTLNNKSVLNTSDFNTMNPSADLRLPAEIFASDDSVSDAGVASTEDYSIQNVLQDQIISTELRDPVAKDKMLGGINIKLEKPVPTSKTDSKKTKKVVKNNDLSLNLADIKTELQDDIDWNNMSLATVNNTNVNRFQNRNRRDNVVKSREEFASLFGTNPNKNDIDDHLENMQSDLDSLRELLRTDSYALDTNTLMGLFGSEDPFYGLSYNSMDDRAKTSNGVEGNQLMSYTGNIPDFELISIPELEPDNSQDACMSPPSTTLNTPQVQVNSPMDVLRP